MQAPSSPSTYSYRETNYSLCFVYICRRLFVRRELPTSQGSLLVRFSLDWWGWWWDDKLGEDVKRGRKQEKEGRKNQVGSRERITQPLYSLCTSCTAMKNAAKSIQLDLHCDISLYTLFLLMLALDWQALQCTWIWLDDGAKFQWQSLSFQCHDVRTAVSWHQLVSRIDQFSITMSSGRPLSSWFLG